MEEKSKLTTQNYWNPFFINGYEICKISIYNETGIIVTIDRGWLFDAGNNEFKTIEFDFPIKNHRKVRLDKKESFIVSSVNCLGEKKKHLFLHSSLLKNFSFKESVLERTDKTDNVFKDVYAFDVVGERKVLEKIDGTYRHVIKSGEWHMKGSANYKFVRTEFGQMLSDFSAKAKKVNVTLSSYDFEKLLKVFNISIKKDPE